MPRAKRGFKARRRRNRILKHAEGFYSARSRIFGDAVEAVRNAWQYAYIGRRLRRRDFRRLWITRINAAARTAGTTYSRLIPGLKKANVILDRKILSELAVSDPPAFAEVVRVAKGLPPAAPTSPRGREVAGRSRFLRSRRCPRLRHRAN
ncbi:MAG: 50S ribosomal protein L20 [Polyangiaceae bacterium]|nr:50S ribosomal protein L20 [Polyangiaceae bacterium]